MQRSSGRKLNQMTVVGMAAAFCAFTETTVAEPELTVTPQSETARVGEPFPLEYTITWEGEPEDWQIMPPQAEDLEWAAFHVREARAHSQDNTHVVAFTVEVTPFEEGEFELRDVHIGFLSPEDLSPLERSENPAPSAGPDASPRLRADPLTLRVLPQRTMAGIFGPLGALIVLLLLPIGWGLARLIRKPPAEPSPVPADSSPEEIRAILTECRTRRMEGAYYDFYNTLARAAGLITSETSELTQLLRARAQEIGYGGAHPTPDDMEGHLREVEQTFKASSGNAATGK